MRKPIRRERRDKEPRADSHGRGADDEDRNLARAMAQLKPREREMLWLAYAHGSSHEEIAESLGLRKSSIKILLFRARRRLAAAMGVSSPAKEVRS